MKEKLKNFLKNNYKVIILYIFILSLIFIKLDYQIYSPGSLLNLNNKIEIDASYKSEGSFNLTYVNGKPGNLIFVLASFIIPSWDLISISDNRIDIESEEDINERNKVYLDDVNQNAIIVAFNELGINYKTNNKGVYVVHIYEYAETNLKVGDIIISLNNIKINSIEDFSIISDFRISQKINLKVLRDKKELEVYAIIKNFDNKNIIGIIPTNKIEIESDIKIKFKFKDNEMGPSGGLMTLLQIYDMLNLKDITKGRKISGTGTINEVGEVGAISGIKYKLKGAVNKKADIFICPSENYEECLSEKNKNNYNIKLIKADTFKNVLNKLNE